MQEAEATKARAVAEAEGAKAKAEALAAYDGVAQRVEILKLQLEAQVQIEVAKAESLAKAMASMNIKMIGDPNAAASLLRLVTFADGLGEVVKAMPPPLLDMGQQMLNKLTGSTNGDGLVKLADGEAANSITELATLVPEIIRVTEKNLNIDRLKGQTVGEVLAMLSKQAGSEPIVEKAQKALEHLPIIRDLPFDEFYLRALAK
jgi:uncharacterized membrane protein YqiK